MSRNDLNGEMSRHHQPDRRRVLVAGSALVGAAVLPGAPGDTGVWGFRLEGHHLHQSIAVRDGQIVSVSPSSFSCNPNRVTSGRHAGLVTLQAEEALARRLIGDLGPRLQGRARLSNTPI